MNFNKFASLILDRYDYNCNVCDIQTHEVLYMSQAAMKMYGIVHPDEYRKQKCYKLLHGLDNPCSFCVCGQLALNEPYDYEYFDEEFKKWFDIHDVLVEFDGRMCRLRTQKEITIQKGILVPQFSPSTKEEVLFHCIHLLNKEKDFNKAVHLLLENVADYYQAERAYIFEVDQKNLTISNTFEWCRSLIDSQIDNLQNFPFLYIADWEEKFRKDGEFVIYSVDEELTPENDDYQILKSLGIDSLLSAPLFDDGKFRGFIGVDNPKKNIRNLVLIRSIAVFINEELDKHRLITKLEKISYIDALTGLRNRNYYNRTLDIYQSKTPETLGIVLLDINGMRQINDTYGREYGDQIIKQLGIILKEQFLENVYRISGDEFAVLCSGISSDLFKDKVSTLRLTLKNADFENIVSMGFSWNFDQDDLNITAIFQQAEEVRRVAKQSYYRSSLKEERVLSRKGLLKEVLREIEEDRFLVYYQPQTSIQSKNIIGAEALIRKKDENGVVLTPNKFLPFYEAGGVVSYIDLFVMRNACKTLKMWQDSGHDLQISVNFSRITLLEPSIVKTLSEICAEYVVSPSLITIEVTESIGRMDESVLKNLMMELKEVGFSISLDDFGSEYSNLSILSALDFDEIKFDRSLVNAIEQNERSRIVIENGLNLCRALKGTVSLAEGIETKKQLELLMEYSCDYGQGYYFSRPIPLEQFNTFLSQFTLQ